MGLDMYAVTAPKRFITKDVDFDLDGVEGVERLHYWRKHPNLHGLMEDIYRDKDGASEAFNCDTLALDHADLNRI